MGWGGCRRRRPDLLPLPLSALLLKLKGKKKYTHTRLRDECVFWMCSLSPIGHYVLSTHDMHDLFNTEKLCGFTLTKYGCMRDNSDKQTQQLDLHWTLHLHTMRVNTLHFLFSALVAIRGSTQLISAELLLHTPSSGAKFPLDSYGVGSSDSVVQQSFTQTCLNMSRLIAWSSCCMCNFCTA